jgi:enoyl-CoA hydratase/carnithine racemase
MMEPVSVAIEDGVALVVVDSPPVNAMSRAVLGGLTTAGRQIESAGTDVRAVVLAGSGTKAFLAGADITEFESMRATAGGVAEHNRLAGAAFDAWARLRQPTIAAVQAPAVGGGLEIALVCDLIVADPAATFGLPEVKLGLIPGGGGTQRLPRRIGATAAKEMLLLGSVVKAERAHALGLVNRVAPAGGCVALAQEIAARIAALPWVAVSCVKRAVDGPGEDGLREGLDHERELFLQAFASEDAGEGAAAFLAKRRPSFAHR